MKVSLSWLKQLVKYNFSAQELADLLSLKSIGVKQVSEDFLELDLTYNRGDLLSLRGVAREVAAIIDSEVTFESPPDLKSNLPTTPVKIEDENLSPLQCVAKIEGLKVQPSSNEWIKRLGECGMRSVNNIADVTNLIMLEYGQPLHSFDEATVKNDTINVRAAQKGEEIVTLDGKLRKLEGSDIVLADTEKALDVAGVMGGKDTEIKESTNTILLSASMFNPVMVRNTAQRLGLHSEASKRFQHGLTKTNLLQALSAAIKMYEELGGKLTAITIIGDTEDKPKVIHLTQDKINSLLGVNIPVTQVESSLKSLGFSLNAGDVTIPYWRLDCNIEEDLIEEVARIYGYEKIPDTPLDTSIQEKLDQSEYEFIQKLKDSCKDAGLTEVSTYSFYSTNVLNNADYIDDPLIKISNPISSETEFLRNHLWPNLVETASKNIRNGFKDMAIFELGKIYQLDKTNINEEYSLCLLLVNNSDNPVDELYQIFRKVMESLKLDIPIGEQIGESKGRFHPTRYSYLTKGGQPVGKLGEIHPKVINKFGVEQRVAVVEISLEKLNE